MKNIAFLYTEYQQNILFSICEQENIKFDIIFIKDNIKINKYINLYTKEVIVYKNIHYKVSNILNYYNEFNANIKKHLKKNDKYLIFTWSIENPIVRFSLLYLKDYEVNLIEDGTGSYIDWQDNKLLGIKSFIAISLIKLLTNVFSLSKNKIKNKVTKGWSLFRNSFPEFDIKKNIIQKKYFIKVINTQSETCKNNIELKDNSLVFISSPYVEVGLLKEEEYLEILLSNLKKIKKVDYFYWKPHPRISLKKEQQRINFINNKLNINFHLININTNIELIAYMNRYKKIIYTSLGSTSLYVLKALNIDNILLLEVKWEKKILLEVNNFLKKIL